jgi:hypothetical protein
MIDVIKFFGIYLQNFCKLLHIDFSFLATYRKSQMRSAVSSSSAIHAILGHGARFFFPLAYWEDGDKGLDQAMETKVERRTNLCTSAL